MSDKIINRYEFAPESCDGDAGKCYAEMQLDPEGEYYLVADVIKSIEQLEAEVVHLKHLLQLDEDKRAAAVLAEAVRKKKAMILERWDAGVKPRLPHDPDRVGLDIVWRACWRHVTGGEELPRPSLATLESEYHDENRRDRHWGDDRFGEDDTL